MPSARNHEVTGNVDHLIDCTCLLMSFALYRGPSTTEKKCTDVVKIYNKHQQHLPNYPRFQSADDVDFFPDFPETLLEKAGEAATVLSPCIQQDDGAKAF